MIRASRVVAHPPARVFALLADLERHWPLLGDDLAAAEIHDRTDFGGAVLTLRVRPWPARRVVTRVLVCEPQSLLAGDAHAGGTRAWIEWRISPVEQASEITAASTVSLSAVIDAAGARDRLLAGLSRPWLRRRCHAVLKRLEHELELEVAACTASARGIRSDSIAVANPAPEVAT